MTHPRLTASYRTDPGRDPAKQSNEDAVAYEDTPFGALAIVCDGMGGHARGAEASQLAIRTVLEVLRRGDPSSHPGLALKHAVEEAGRRVYELARVSDLARPGSTLVALLVHTGGTEVAHCGDSRAYLLRRGTLLPLTRDHSLVREMVDSGQLRADEASGHPDSNKITRALGLRADCGVEVRPLAFVQEARDVFLLMSDGITDVINDADLQALAEGGLTEGMDALAGRAVHIANARGGPDNITLLALHIDEPGVLADRVATRARHPVPSADRGATQRGDTVTDDIFPGPAVPAAAAPAAAAVAPADARGPGAATTDARGQTQVLSTDHQKTAGAVAAPVIVVAAPVAPSAPVSPPQKGGTAKLPVHGGTADTGSRLPLAEVAPTRGKRLYVGVGLMVVGIIGGIVSVVSLDEKDEAPPPLLEGPKGAALPAPSKLGGARLGRQCQDSESARMRSVLTRPGSADPFVAFITAPTK